MGATRQQSVHPHLLAQLTFNVTTASFRGKRSPWWPWIWKTQSSFWKSIQSFFCNSFKVKTNWNIQWLPVLPSASIPLTFSILEACLKGWKNMLAQYTVTESSDTGQSWLVFFGNSKNKYCIWQLQSLLKENKLSSLFILKRRHQEIANILTNFCKMFVTMPSVVENSKPTLGVKILSWPWPRFSPISRDSSITHMRTTNVHWDVIQSTIGAFGFMKS